MPEPTPPSPGNSPAQTTPSHWGQTRHIGYNASRALAYTSSTVKRALLVLAATAWPACWVPAFAGEMAWLTPAKAVAACKKLRRFTPTRLSEEDTGLELLLSMRFSTGLSWLSPLAAAYRMFDITPSEQEAPLPGGQLSASPEDLSPGSREDRDGE